MTRRAGYTLAALTAVAALFLWSTRPVQGDPGGLPYPDGYRSWTHVKSMVILSDEHPLFESFGGLHNVYVNPAGSPALTSGGPYPDGTVFVFDLFAITSDGGAITASDRKFIAVMVKDAAKFADTGGWGWEVFMGNARVGGNVSDPAADCFTCHESEADRDYIFSRFQQ